MKATYIYIKTSLSKLHHKQSLSYLRRPQNKIHNLVTLKILSQKLELCEFLEDIHLHLQKILKHQKYYQLRHLRV